MHIPAVRLGLRACTTRHRSPRRSWWVGGGNWGATPVPLGFLGATRCCLVLLGATSVPLRIIGATLVPHWGASTGWRRARGLSPAFFQPTGALRWRRQCLGCPLLALRAGAPPGGAHRGAVFSQGRPGLICARHRGPLASWNAYASVLARPPQLREGDIFIYI